MDAIGLNRLARRQGGLFTRKQAYLCGFSAYQVRRRVRVGEWKTVMGSVLAPASLEITIELRDRAAQLAVPGSVLAGPSAARRWHIPVPDERTFLLVGPHAGPRLAGVGWIFEKADPRDIGSNAGAPITTRERTIIDCLRILPEHDALELLDHALQQQWVTIDDLISRIRRYYGRRGKSRLIRLLSAVNTGTRSTAERLMANLLTSAGVTGWQLNVAISDADGVIGVADVVLDAPKLIIELDGLALRTTPDSLQHDRERQNRLVRAGWVVLRFTWQDLTRRPEYVIDTTQAMLRRSANGDPARSAV